MGTMEFELVCPVCEEHLTHATALDNTAVAPPTVGDVTVCASCATLLELDEQLKPFKIDISTLEPEIQALVLDAQAFLKSRLGRRLLH